MSVLDVKTLKGSSLSQNGEFNFRFSEDDQNLYGKERSRPVLTAKYLESTYEYNDRNGENILKDSLHYIKKYYMPTADNCKAFIRKRIPPIEWIPKYDIRKNLVKDLTGGITVNHF
jgi:hypothetical protein